MKNNSLLLSICIPTFNRLSYLRESLSSLLPQLEKHRVEVCISDNCSSDGTADYLKKISGEYSCLRYMSQAKTVSLDENMGLVISMARGDYIYPLGDDDVIIAASLHVIMQELENGSDVVIQNGWHTDSKLIPKRLHLQSDLQSKEFSSPVDAFKHLWDKMPFGSFLAKRECFQEKDFIRYLGTSHAYAGVVWDALADKYQESGFCKIKCASQPTVLLRGCEKTWRNDAGNIVLCQVPKWFSLIMQKEVYRPLAEKIRMSYIDQQTNFMSLIYFRAKHQLGASVLDDFSRECSPQQIKRVRAVAHTPQVVANWIMLINNAATSITKFILQK